MFFQKLSDLDVSSLPNSAVAAVRPTPDVNFSIPYVFLRDASHCIRWCGFNWV